MITVDPIGPEVPPALATLLRSIRDAIGELQNPGEPVPLWSVVEADLPPPADWTDHFLRVSDIDVVAFSNGVDWIRTDTGAPV